MKCERAVFRDESLRAIEGEEEGRGPMVVGRGIPYNEWSQDLGGFRERFASGSVAVSLSEDDPRAVFNHNTDKVIGRQSNGTARFREEEDGVHFEADPPDAGWARDMLASIERGDIRENSFQFWVERKEDQEWEERDGILWRTIKKARVREMGPQSFPAYPSSSVQVRSSEAVLAEGREILDAARSSEGIGETERRRMEMRQELEESLG